MYFHLSLLYLYFFLPNVIISIPSKSKHLSHLGVEAELCSDLISIGVAVPVQDDERTALDNNDDSLRTPQSAMGLVH